MNQSPILPSSTFPGGGDGAMPSAVTPAASRSRAPRSSSSKDVSETPGGVPGGEALRAGIGLAGGVSQQHVVEHLAAIREAAVELPVAQERQVETAAAG